ncbi:hypothetical protein JZ751_005505 [Albula glossodonta]|uniref:Uncharacterized protein n=1 Tax=Albula glossodonta TaxID=121402 RepID=A0A8T2N4B1_9TELE|nr:hypothetical protein JZ751_005505 [Albula glossodonta]
MSCVNPNFLNVTHCKDKGINMSHEIDILVEKMASLTLQSQKTTQGALLEEKMKIMEEEFEKKIAQIKKEMVEKEETVTAMVEGYKMAAEKNLDIAKKCEKALEKEKRKSARLRRKMVTLEKVTLLVPQTENLSEQTATELKHKEQWLAAMYERLEDRKVVLAQKITETVAMQLSLKQENKRREEDAHALKKEMVDKEAKLAALGESHKKAASENLVRKL